MSELHVRDATEADLDAVLTIRSRSFGPLGSTGGQRWWRSVSDETLGGRMLVAVDTETSADSEAPGGRVVGAGRIRPFQQSWGGRPLPMGGVAGVYVDPAARGRGVASMLGRALVQRQSELGDVLSCLYPTAPGLYRGVGYEVGGAQTRFTYAADSLRALRPVGPGVRVRAAAPSDADRFEELDRDRHRRHRLCGPVAPSAATWRTRLADDEMIHYIADDGFVAYSLANGTLTVESLVAASPTTSAALWSVVGSGSSAAATVNAWLDPRDPVLLGAGVLPAPEVRTMPWMLRVIDLPGAVSDRGFATGLQANASLSVTDPDAPANTGVWTIAVADGRGKAVLRTASPLPTCTTHTGAGAGSSPEGAPDRYDASRVHPSTPGGAAASGLRGEPVALGPRGLAGLWSGWSMSRLRQAGLATGGSPDDDMALGAIFAAEPFMTEYF